MIVSKLRKSGNSFVVTVPREEIERLGIQEGQLLAVEVRPVEVRPRLSPELRQAFESSWQRHEATYRQLAR
ncbi:MAG: hypothetical protein U0821_19675 [Chloroflexota bacterium]